MSYTPGDLVDAANIQENLNQQFINTQDPITMQAIPFLQGMVSPENRGGLQQSIAIGNGQKRTVEVLYDQEFDVAQVESNVANPLCDASSFTPSNNSQEYTIDTSINRSMSYKVTRSELETAKVDPQTWVLRNLQKAINVVEVAVDRKESAAAVALYGEWSTDTTDWADSNPDVSINGSDELVVKTRKDSSVDPYPYTAQNIAAAAEYCGYTSAPMIYSGTLLRDWATAGDAGTYATTDGGNSVQASYDRWGFSVQYSQAIAQAFGVQTKALMVHPGALQLLFFTVADWRTGMPGVMEGSNYFQTIVNSPRTGIPMDLMVKDDCGTITVRVTLTSSLVGLPTDMFNPNMRYDGVTFVNKLLVTNA